MLAVLRIAKPLINDAMPADESHPPVDYGNLAMISILNRPHELRVHIKGALVNGVTKDEIREIFMQVAIYAGIPAGVDSFRIAREVFAELDKG